jgi:hypothetical protein
MNSGPLSDWIEVGRPKHGMISVPRIEARVEALFLVMGKASTQPKKVSTSTRRYLVLFIEGIWVKLVCQSMVGIDPLAW